jgi:hypothetical protein
MSATTTVIVVAVAVVVIGWLYVSFAPPGKRRALVEWIAASALFAALLGFFSSLALRALEQGNRLALAGFGFLTVFFTLGLVVSVGKTIAQRRGDRSTGPSATA